MISAALGLFLMNIWIQEYGLLGAAYGFLAGKVMLVITKTLFAYSVHPLRFRLLKPTLVLVSAYLFALAIQYVEFDSNWLELLGRSGLLLAFVAMVWFVFVPGAHRRLLAEKGLAGILAQIRKVKEK